MWKAVTGKRDIMDSEMEEFFQWKSKLKNQGFPKITKRKLDQGEATKEKEMTVKELMENLRLRKSIKKFRIPLEQKMIWRKPQPNGKAVRHIVKWKELDDTQADLEEMRGTMNERLEEFAERRRRVEEGQRMIKQNLVKFNGFVKEKQGKVAEDKRRSNTEMERQQQREEFIVRY